MMQALIVPRASPSRATGRRTATAHRQLVVVHSGEVAGACVRGGGCEFKYRAGQGMYLTLYTNKGQK